METNTELKDACNEVLMKIGGNLLLFQKAEQLLKLLLTWGSFRTTLDKPAVFEEFADVWSKQTMGQLKSQFLSRHCTQTGDALADFNPDSPGIAMTFTLGSSDGYFEQRKAAIEMLVAERNELVHHLAPEFDRTSLESCRNMSAYLDEQRAKVLPEIENLKADCKCVHELMPSIFEFLKTKEGMKTLEKPDSETNQSTKPKRRRKRSKQRRHLQDGRPGRPTDH